MEPNTVISLIALIFAGLALAISLYESLSNRPKLRIRVSHRIMVGGGVSEKVVVLNAVNVGRQPTTITGMSFGKNKSTTHYFPTEFHAYSEKLPKKINPGEQVDISFIADKKSTFDQETLTLEELLRSKKLKAIVYSSWAKKPKYFEVTE
jgi:hypothetical protein